MPTLLKGQEVELIGGPLDGSTVILPCGWSVFAYRTGPRVWSQYRLQPTDLGVLLVYQGLTERAGSTERP